jgi:hypothetical protein
MRYSLVFLGLFTLLICSLDKHWKNLGIVALSQSWSTSRCQWPGTSLFSKHAAHSLSPYLLRNTPPPPPLLPRILQFLGLQDPDAELFVRIRILPSVNKQT